MATLVLGSGGDMIADPWSEAKQIIGAERVTLGPQASAQYLNDPEHLAFVLARYRVAAALISGARRVLEIGCGEGIGAGILAKGRESYIGVDTDWDALKIAEVSSAVGRRFCHGDALTLNDDMSNPLGYLVDAVVGLDVIEHITAGKEDRLLRSFVSALYQPFGALVIGTPSKNAEHLASRQSRAGHVNLYTPDRLRVLMQHYFHVVQFFGMQDTALHLGHPDMAHYLIAVGIGPKRD